MDAATFLGLQATHNRMRWNLPITEGIATREKFMFGGCGLAAAVEAMERSCERPVVWATAQYLSFAMVDSIMDLDVTISVSGKRTSQARVVGHVEDREILTVNAALGAKDLPHEGQWRTMPDVPAPEDCVARSAFVEDSGSIMGRLKLRLAHGMPWDKLAVEGPGERSETGRSALWVATPSIETSAAALAILGDYVPFGISQALGEWLPANSLDNTIRVHQLVKTDWVLVDVRIDGVQNGFGHGSVHLWAQDGTLLATASQTAVLHSKHRFLEQQQANTTTPSESTEQDTK